MTNPRDLALFGAGYWGKNLARNFNALGSLHTICDKSVAVLSSYATEYSEVRKTESIDHVLQDPIITKIAIAAPAIHHYALAKSALLAGKDVFVEKPLCLDTQQAEEITALAESKGRILMVGHLLQYHPCILKLLDMVMKGELGKLGYISSNRLNLGKIRQEENSLWSFAPHDISVILALAGNTLPEHVRCTGSAYLDPAVVDTTVTTMKFQSGVRAHVFVSWLNPFKEQKLTVVGSDGMAVFDDTRPWKEKLLFYRKYLTWSGGQVPVPSKAEGQYIEVPEAEPLREECLEFLRACELRRKPRTDGREGIRVLKVLQAAQKSLDGDGEKADLSKTAGTANERSYYVHPTAIVDDGAQLGEGTKVWHFAHISAGARIGRKCILGQNTFVADGVVIGENTKIQNNVAVYTGTTIEADVFLGPSCVLTNVTNPRSQVVRHSLYEATTIKRGATVGANATIVCGVTLGRYSFIAAGAVVSSDVPDYGMAVGVPARIKGWMSRHGLPLKFDKTGSAVCPESGYRYKETAPGVVRCLDLDEEQALPSTLAKGIRSYDDFKSDAKVK